MFNISFINQGITYSMMSASWDPEREGSLLGTDEFTRNVENIKSGLSRSRDNAMVREKIMLEKNSNKNKQESGSNRKKQPAKSFIEKMGDEIEK